ncbi:hypothetical protein [Synechococcus sp. PCC 6312]|uniref:hypothetical protein n=1 Tax=Synechococcus sp. (strain ATCC 27167 / PCC 6312) TaxID=195253 RepID=UPI00029EDC7D|nr:hypothetical protein [Synechococcus sp. PCC 6312]AFY60435.1 hypothetical protein Syn6312_1253 [Synechococcus sp. PCC 6312]
MKSLLFKTLVLLPVVTVAVTALPAWAEREVRVANNGKGTIYTVDMDSLSVYVGNQGVKQVNFKLSTVGDEYWHDATASCNPYDVKSEFYNWSWSGTRSYPAGTIAGDIARAVCP